MVEDPNRDDDRDEKGRFRSGNPGGPGRPRRAVEREYLGVLCDTVSLKDWRAVCSQAVKDAKAGDWRARDWLTQYVVGNEPISLRQLAALEIGEVSVDDEIGDEQRRVEMYRAMNAGI